MRYFKVTHSTGKTFVRSSRGAEFTNAVVSPQGIVSLHRDWRQAQAKLTGRGARPDWEEIALVEIDKVEYYGLQRAGQRVYTVLYRGRSYTKRVAGDVRVVGAVALAADGRTRMHWFIDEGNLQRFAREKGAQADQILRPTLG